MPSTWCLGTPMDGRISSWQRGSKQRCRPV
jgi:hypothetical protein